MAATAGLGALLGVGQSDAAPGGETASEHVDSAAAPTDDASTSGATESSAEPMTSEPVTAEADQPVSTSASTTTVAPAAAASDGTHLGTVEGTRWGDVQVDVSIAGGEIVDVEAVQIPGGRSARYSNAAEPVLEAQAIQTQGADLDIVTGATYTSQAYEESLQAALDAAGFTASTGAAGE